MKLSTPMVSILMPVYNAAPYLKDAIESILNQTYQDFEFLIINDGSTDNSEDIILSYEDQRIRYVKNPKNLKLIATLNKGLELVKGKFIARMDADDISIPTRVEQQVSVMLENNDLAVCGGFCKLFRDGKDLGGWNYPEHHNDIKSLMFFGNAIAHSTTMLRKSVLERHNFRYDPNYIHAEDWKLWLDMIDQGHRFYNIPDVLVKYRRNATSVSATFKQEQINMTLRILYENVAYHFPALKSSKYQPEIKNFFRGISVKHDQASFKALDNFLGKLRRENKKTMHFDVNSFNKILLNIWRMRFPNDKDALFSKIPLIVGSPLLLKSPNRLSLMSKILSIYFNGEINKVPHLWL